MRSLCYENQFSFINIEIGTNYHNKNFALRLALKERLRETWKWPIKFMQQRSHIYIPLSPQLQHTHYNIQYPVYSFMHFHSPSSLCIFPSFAIIYLHLLSYTFIYRHLLPFTIIFYLHLLLSTIFIKFLLNMIFYYLPSLTIIYFRL